MSPGSQNAESRNGLGLRRNIHQFGDAAFGNPADLVDIGASFAFNFFGIGSMAVFPGDGGANGRRKGRSGGRNRAPIVR